MKKLASIIAVVFAVVLSTSVFAQNTSTVAATSTAKVISKIEIAQVTPLNFGSIAQTAQGGTVTLSAASDVATYSNSSTVVGLSSESRGRFNVSGEANAVYSIVLPGTATLTKVSSTETMTISSFVTGNSLTASTLDGTGNDSFYVGAVLTVGELQAVGTYNGTYNVTVNYN